MFEASRESTIDEQFCYFIVIPYKIITYIVQCKCQSIARATYLLPRRWRLCVYISMVLKLMTVYECLFYLKLNIDIDTLLILIANKPFLKS